MYVIVEYLQWGEIAERSTRSESEDDIRRSKIVSGSVPSQLGRLPYTNHGILPIYDSTDSLESRHSLKLVHRSSFIDGSTRFPKLEECAHFHYDLVELTSLQVAVIHHDNRADAPLLRADPAERVRDLVFALRVTTNGKSWTLQRSFSNFRHFDHLLHKCIFDRRFSHLPKIQAEWAERENQEEFIHGFLGKYTKRFSEIAGSMLNCGPILNWLELDNRGNRLLVVKDSGINTPAIAAAHAVRRYIAQAPDEISLEVGDIVSVIDMPPLEESCWWRGKRGFEVGFFPLDCVEVIGDKVPQAVTAKMSPKSKKPLLRKNGKLATLFRGFFSTRPSRNQLKQSGIVKERVFGCDLGEHLLNASLDVPLVLRACCHVIEDHGIVDGIYRLSGISSNIQKLRLAFDEDRVPDLTEECYRLDIHSISSLVKMYLRELPNPLLTYQLYDKFAEAVQDEENKLMKIHDVVQQLPPPHYRTTEFLMRHLARVASHSQQTGMHSKNLAIVWAPNLLRSKELEMGGGAAALQGVGIQAVVTEFLICYVDLIFSDKLPTQVSRDSTRNQRKPRPKSLAISTPTRLLSLEEARERALSTKYIHEQKYIEVGGGPESLPTRYHTVLDLPGYRKKNQSSAKDNVVKESVKTKKSTTESRAGVATGGWKSFFSKTRNSSVKEKAPRKSSIPDGRISPPDHKIITEDDVHNWKRRRLRSSKSVESLMSSPDDGHISSRDGHPGADDDDDEMTPTPLRKRRSSSGSRSRSQSLDQTLLSTTTPQHSVALTDPRVIDRGWTPCSDGKEPREDLPSYDRADSEQRFTSHRKTVSAPANTSDSATPNSGRKFLNLSENTPHQRKKATAYDVSEPVNEVTIPKQLQEKFVLHVSSPDFFHAAHDSEETRKSQRSNDGKSPKSLDRKIPRSSETKSPRLDKSTKYAKSGKKSKVESILIDTPVLQRSPNASRKYSAPEISPIGDLDFDLMHSAPAVSLETTREEYMSHFIQPTFSSIEHDYAEIDDDSDDCLRTESNESKDLLPSTQFYDDQTRGSNSLNVGLSKSSSIPSGIENNVENVENTAKLNVDFKSSKMELSRSIDSFSAGLSEDNILCRVTSLDGGTEVTSLSHTLREITEQIDKAFGAFPSNETQDDHEDFLLPVHENIYGQEEEEGSFYFGESLSPTSHSDQSDDFHLSRDFDLSAADVPPTLASVTISDPLKLVSPSTASQSLPENLPHGRPDVLPFDHLTSEVNNIHSPVILESSSIFYDFEPSSTSESIENLYESPILTPTHSINHFLKASSQVEGPTGRIIDVNYVDNLIRTHTRSTQIASQQESAFPGLSPLSNVIDAYCASFKPNETPTDEQMEHFLLGDDDNSISVSDVICQPNMSDNEPCVRPMRLQPVTEAINETSFSDEADIAQTDLSREYVVHSDDKVSDCLEIHASKEFDDLNHKSAVNDRSVVKPSDYVINLTDFEMQIARLKQNMDLVLKDISTSKGQDKDGDFVADTSSANCTDAQFDIVLNDSDVLNTAYSEGDYSTGVLTSSQTDIVWNIDSPILEEHRNDEKLLTSIQKIDQFTENKSDSDDLEQGSFTGGHLVENGTNCGSKRPYGQVLAVGSSAEQSQPTEITCLNSESPTKKLKETRASIESLLQNDGWQDVSCEFVVDYSFIESGDDSHAADYMGGQVSGSGDVTNTVGYVEEQAEASRDVITTVQHSEEQINGFGDGINTVNHTERQVDHSGDLIHTVDHSERQVEGSRARGPSVDHSERQVDVSGSHDSLPASEKILNEISSPPHEVIVIYRPSIVKPKNISKEFSCGSGNVEVRSTSDVSPSDTICRPDVISVVNIPSQCDMTAKLITERRFCDKIQTCYATKVEKPLKYEPPKLPIIRKPLPASSEIFEKKPANFTNAPFVTAVNQERNERTTQVRESPKVPNCTILTEISAPWSNVEVSGSSSRSSVTSAICEKLHNSVKACHSHESVLREHDQYSKMRMASSAYGALEQSGDFLLSVQKGRCGDGQPSLPSSRNSVSSENSDSSTSVVDNNELGADRVSSGNTRQFSVQKSSSFPNVQNAMTSSVSDTLTSRRSSGKLQSLRELFEPSSDQNQSPNIINASSPKPKVRPLSACLQPHKSDPESPEPHDVTSDRHDVDDSHNTIHQRVLLHLQDQNLPPSTEKPLAVKWKSADKLDAQKLPQANVDLQPQKRSTPISRERSFRSCNPPSKFLDKPPRPPTIPHSPRSRIHSDSTAVESKTQRSVTPDAYGSLDRDRLKRTDHEQKGSIKELMAVFEGQNAPDFGDDLLSQSPYSSSSPHPALSHRPAARCLLEIEKNEPLDATIRQPSLRLGPKPFSSS